jgi:hypothetical protein
VIHEPGCRERRTTATALAACICGGALALPQQLHQVALASISLVQVSAPPFEHVELPHPPDRDYADSRAAADRMTQAPPPAPSATPFVQQRPRMPRSLPPRRALVRGTRMFEPPFITNGPAPQGNPAAG